MKQSAASILALEHLIKSDKTLAKIIRKAERCTLKKNAKESPYEMLIRSVVYQQLHGKAAATILARVRALFDGPEFPSPDAILAMSEDKLRGAGLSRAKLAAIRDIARHTKAGQVPTSKEIEKLEDEVIIERLTQIRGVGPWTVQMLLMFQYARPDVLPATDFGVRKGFSIAYGLKDLPTPKELIAHGEKWRPHRSTASWYMWWVANNAPKTQKQPKKKMKSKGKTKPKR